MKPRIETLLTDAVSARQRMLERTKFLSTHQGAFKPSPERWSVAEVIEHLVLAEVHGGIRMMWTALEATRDGNPVWTKDHPDRDEPIETIATTRMKPKETAPPGATPTGQAPLPYWVASFETGQFLLERLAGALRPGEIERVSYPHFLMGPLTVRQRFEFIRWHIDHHLPQVDALLNDPAFPEAPGS